MERNDRWKRERKKLSQVTCALTIAGTDPSGGAGIQADLKTFQELECYGMSVITSVVAQNTLGVTAVEHMPIDMVRSQLDAVFSDMPVHACKTGMIATIDMLTVVRDVLEGRDIPLIIDPVMVATSGDPLITEEARDYMRDQLLPLSAVVTPNIPEAAFLTGMSIHDLDDMKEAAKLLVHEYGAGAALVKGGHLSADQQAVDFLYDGKTFREFTAERIDTKNTHGTGCTYAAAITAFMSKGDDLYTAVSKAKRFITAAIRHSFDLGAGSGPTNHFAVRHLLEEELDE